jgi:putative ABC transport system permease protein
MWKEILKQALASLARNKTRSGLTLLGIAWGVACFVLLFAYGTGFTRALNLGMAYFGDNVIIIWNGQTSKQAGGQRAGRRVAMRLTDVEDIQKNASLIRQASPEFYRRYPIQTLRRFTTDGVRGVNHRYGNMRGHFIEEGRLLTADDVQNARRVAVIGDGLRSKLFSEAPALGEEIRIDGLPFTVVGVLKKKVAMSNYFSPDDTNAFIPYTAMAALTSTRYLSVMVVQPVNPVMEQAAVRQVRSILARNHRFDPDDERAVLINSWQEGYEQLRAVTTGVRVFLLIMGILTLSVGGVGLMNVMLVAVTERTREIGLRKALGARRRQILTQFLAETVTISFIGGLLGYLLVRGLTLAVPILPFWSTILGDTTQQADIHLIVSLRAVLVAGVSLGSVALLSGLWPALRASRLDPVLALHHE